ncbi:MAG TPA: M28 family peptidase [Chitinophagaceae bacterium]|nr:M28 family peptidase [Chitinophagaceae bacterium]
MKKLLLLAPGCALSLVLFAQTVPGSLSTAEVERVERTLSSDDMRGRRAFTPDIDRAADFIASEFRAAGLQPLPGNRTYLQEFWMVQPKFISASGTMDGEAVDASSLVVITCQPELKVDDHSGYEKVRMAPDANLFAEARKYLLSGRNQVVLVPTKLAANFLRLTGMKRGLFKTDKSLVFVLTDKDPVTYSFEAHHQIREQRLANVVGILPGRSRPKEYVIFSGHYDHLGVTQPVNGDSIYNGANDDAAGTTAVILLARYFKQKGDNERTLVFAAFTAEELGAYGSQYFSRQFDPAQVMAMFNIEMIGTQSKWGKDAAYITGYDKTDMGQIMQKNLAGTGFTFYPDPYTDQHLFYRSDNATLARQGVPAHTISTSKMDNEPNYHKVSDQIETLDLDNMARIIQSIALSARTIISGQDTPTRVHVEDLQ